LDKKYNYDKESDSLYIWLKEGEEEDFEEIAPGVNIELDKDNNIIGVEVLHVSNLFAKGKKKSSLAKGNTLLTT
jgi:uncharacterized protein YuzE